MHLNSSSGNVTSLGKDLPNFLAAKPDIDLSLSFLVDSQYQSPSTDSNLPRSSNIIGYLVQLDRKTPNIVLPCE